MPRSTFLGGGGIQRLFGKKTEQPQEKRNGTSEKKVS
jgi:hypothetical protein